MMQTLISDSFAAPKVAARRILDLGLPLGTGVLALVGTVSASVVLFFLISGPAASTGVGTGVPFSPLMLAATAIGTMALLSLALTICGWPFQGKGTFEQAFMLMAWLQALLLGLQLVQLILALVSFQAAGIFGILVVGFTFWLLLNFIQELHQLATLGHAAFVLLLAFVGLVLAFSFLVTLSGGLTS